MCPNHLDYRALSLQLNSKGGARRGVHACVDGQTSICGEGTIRTCELNETAFTVRRLWPTQPLLLDLDRSCLRFSIHIEAPCRSLYDLLSLPTHWKTTFGSCITSRILASDGKTFDIANSSVTLHGSKLDERLLRLGSSLVIKRNGMRV